MGRFLLRRAIGGILVIRIVTLAVFALFGPGLRAASDISPARLYAGKNPSPEDIAQVERLLGLDRPFYVQYGYALRRLVLGPSADEKARLCPGATATECEELVGRFGRSFEKRRSVDSLIKEAFPVTLSLTLMAALIWMAVSIPIGVLAATRPRSILDRATTIFVLLAQSFPVYYIGLLALFFLAFTIPIFPLGGYEPFSLSNPWPWFSNIILPASILALQFAALYARLMRSQMLDVLGEDSMRSARAQGAPRRRAVWRHGVRNAILPIVTIFGLDLGLLLGGAVLTEVTFGLQGLGDLAVTAAFRFDVPTTAGVVLFSAILIVVANIAVDVVHALLDPRIRLE
ncbi:MAG: ABC transporter permease [Actinomycetota bacterium]